MSNPPDWKGSKASGGWKGQRGTRQQRGYGAAWDRRRNRIMQRDGGICQVCGKAAREVDHIAPKAEGGTDDDANLQAICATCHKAKTQAEGARAQGRRAKQKIGPDGWPS